MGTGDAMRWRPRYAWLDLVSYPLALLLIAPFGWHLIRLLFAMVSDLCNPDL